MNSAFELVPIGADESGGDWELAPIEAEKPSVLKTVALNNPLTAIAETGANLLSQGVALPAIKRLSSGFSSLTVWCGDREVTPIHPFVLGIEVSDTETVNEGLYAFAPDALVDGL